MNPQLSPTDYSNIQSLIEKNLDGGAGVFEVWYNTLLIFVNYQAQCEVTNGSSYDDWDFEQLSMMMDESIEIVEVCDEEGDDHPEIAAVLQVMFN